MDTPYLAPAAADTAEVPTVTLRQAATLLGITEAAVLMRVIRRSLASQVDGDGGRRVPLTALTEALEGEAQPHAPPDLAAAPHALASTVTSPPVCMQLHHAAQRIAAIDDEITAACVARDMALAYHKLQERRALEAETQDYSAAA
jgi:hypothetical protein